MPSAFNSESKPLKPLKWYKSLAAQKGRRESGVFLVEGDRSIEQIAGSYPGEIVEIIAVEEVPTAYRDYPVRRVTESQLNAISQTKTTQSPIAVVRLPLGIYSALLPKDVGSKILLLEEIQDPGNVGTLIRTAAAFDFSGIILSDKCADPLSPKCVQSTAGTVLSLWVRRTSHYIELIKELKRRDFTLVAADIRGDDDSSILSKTDRLLLALGNEGVGLSQTLLDIASHQFRIPIVQEKAESLNVAACGAICMYLSSFKN